MDVDVLELEEQKIAYVEHHGDPMLVAETATKFDIWRLETGFSPMQDCNTYGILHTDPEEVGDEGFRFDVCGTVKEEVPENYYDVKNGLIPAGRYAVIRHSGSYEGLAKVYKSLILDWLPASGEKKNDEPSYLHYINFPNNVPHEDELITDIYLPLKARRMI